jgi:hypothetical protein
MLKINGNGSKWAGDPPDSLEMLFARLAQHMLDPRLEDVFISPARVGVDAGRDPATGQRMYVDGDPIYPDAPNAVRFCGNFLEVSAGFSIDTDDPELIERLTAAIGANQARPDYLAMKARIEAGSAQTAAHERESRMRMRA